MFRYDRLDELIQQTGKKKNYLSIAMGHSGRYLNDARKQNTNIKGNDLLVLAAELGTSPEYLTGQTDEKTANPVVDGLSDYDIKMLAWFHSLAPEQRKAILTLGGAPAELAEAPDRE